MHYLKYSLQEGIGILSFNRSEKYNAFNTDLLNQLSDKLDKLNKDSQLKVLIITGEGKAFSSGVDLKSLLELDTVEKAREFALLLESTSEKIYNFSKPVIAAINGLALGGGFGYATACDIRVVTDETKIGYPAVKLGAILPATCTVYLKNILGEGKTKDLLLTGRMLKGKEIVEMGLASASVSTDNLLEYCKKLATQMMEAPALALDYTKRTVSFGTRLEIEAAKLYAADNFAFLSHTTEWRKRMNDFANKKTK